MTCLGRSAMPVRDRALLQTLRGIENNLTDIHCSSYQVDQLWSVSARLNPDYLIHVLRDSRLAHCLVLVAVKEDKLHQLNLDELHMGNTLFHNSREMKEFWKRIFDVLFSKRRLTLVIRLLRCLPASSVDMARFHKLQEDVQIQMCRVLGETATERVLMDSLFHNAFYLGKSRLFEFFFHSHNKFVQGVLVNIIQGKHKYAVEHVEIVCNFRLSRKRPSRFESCPNKGIGFYQTLHTACQTGLFAKSVQYLDFDKDSKDLLQTPLGVAVSYNQPDLVQLLYKAGAVVSKSELLWLSQHPTLKERCEAERKDAQPSPRSAFKFPSREDVDAAIEIREFLSSKASQPRSLLNLCRLEVAKHVGWGHERDRQVEQLEITDELKDILTFYSRPKEKPTSVTNCQPVGNVKHRCA